MPMPCPCEASRAIAGVLPVRSIAGYCWSWPDEVSRPIAVLGDRRSLAPPIASNCFSELFQCFHCAVAKLTMANLQRTLLGMPTADARTNSNAGDVVEKLQRSRKRLLDLTLRNRLLNFRPGNPNFQDDQKAYKHVVLDGQIEFIWQNLVEQEKQIEVACLTNDQREQIAEELSFQSGTEPSSKSRSWSFPRQTRP